MALVFCIHLLHLDSFPRILSWLILMVMIALYLSLLCNTVYMSFYPAYPIEVSFLLKSYFKSTQKVEARDLSNVLGAQNPHSFLSSITNLVLG